MKLLFLAAALWAQTEVHINVGGGAKAPVHRIEISGLGDLREIVRDDLLFSRYFAEGPTRPSSRQAGSWRPAASSSSTRS